MTNAKRKTASKRKEIAKWIQLWIGPLGWALLIIWYILSISEGCGVDKINQPPAIQDGIRISQDIVPAGEKLPIRVIVKDPDLPDDEIRYFWAAHKGTIGEQIERFQGPEVVYFAPDLPGTDVIEVMVYDRKGDTDKDFCIVTIVEAERPGSP